VVGREKSLAASILCRSSAFTFCRVPRLAKFTEFLVDRFHSWPISVATSSGAAKRYATHTCSPMLFIDSYPVHKNTTTTAAEGINKGLKQSAPSLQQITSIRRFLMRVAIILDTLFERSKHAVFIDRSTASNWLRDSIIERRS
jgi:hypothetical protein